MTKFVCALGFVALAGAAGCSSDSTAPNPLDQIPDFVYVSNQNGSDQLFTYSKGASALLAGSVAGDIDPAYAAAFAAVDRAKVRILAYDCTVSPSGIELRKPLTILWN